MSRKCIALSLSIFLFCVGIVACAHEAILKRKVSERFIVQMDFKSWALMPFQVSPDGRRAANVGGRSGNKVFVVVDGKEEKQYDGIGEGNPIFSSDSKRMVYWAIMDNKRFGVVDGKEEKQYDNIIGEKGGKTIFFDTAANLHYLAQKVNSIYLVEENIE